MSGEDLPVKHVNKDRAEPIDSAQNITGFGVFDGNGLQMLAEMVGNDSD